jgi:hypothetical protein
MVLVVISQQQENTMQLRTIALATALALTSSLAFAQPAQIGSDADRGNGASLNRGPDLQTGESRSETINRSSGTTVGSAPMEREGMRRDRMVPERVAPNAVDEAPAGR